MGPDANTWRIDGRRRGRAGRGPWVSDTRQRYWRLHPRSRAFLWCVWSQAIPRPRQRCWSSTGAMGRFARRTMDLAVAGPLARSASDLALALRVLGGASGDEAKAWSWRLPAPRHKQLKDFRVGYMFDDTFAPVSSDIAKLYEKALDALGKAGAKLERGWPPGLDLQAQFRTYQYLLFALLNADMSGPEREESRRRFEKDPNDISAAATVGPHARWLGETQRRLAFRAVWQKYFESHDVFLLPTGFTAAFPHDHTEPALARVVETPEGKRPYVSEHPLLDLCRHIGGAAGDSSPSWANERRSAGRSPDHGTDVGRRDSHRIREADRESCRWVYSTRRLPLRQAELKNQYFGDVNDYRKYGLLRCFQRAGCPKLLVAWMLTGDDGGRDGSRRSYLESPGRWREYDSVLYTGLQNLLRGQRRPDVTLLEDARALAARLVLFRYRSRRSFGSRSLAGRTPGRQLEAPTWSSSTRTTAWRFHRGRSGGKVRRSTCPGLNWRTSGVAVALSWCISTFAGKVASASPHESRRSSHCEPARE